MSNQSLYEHLAKARAARFKNGKTTAHTGPQAQAIAIQQTIIRDIQNPETKASVRAGLARSWALIDARLSAHRMKPLPKSVDPLKYQQAKAASRKQSNSNRRATPTGIAQQPQQPTTTDKESLSQPDRPPGAEGEGATRTGGDNETRTSSGSQGD